MNQRCAPGRNPGLVAAGFVTFLIALCLAVSIVAATPVRADVGPVPTAGELTVEASPSPSGVGVFAAQRLGTTSEPQTFRYRNTSLFPVTVEDVTLEPPRQGDPSTPAPEPTLDGFAVATDCIGAVLLPQSSCTVEVTFTPLRPGPSLATLRLYHDGRSRMLEQPLGGQGVVGLYQAGAFGELLTYGDAKYFGDLSHVAIESPILGVAATPTGEGYWMMEAAGRMHPFGDAADLGSPDLPDAEYAIAVAPTPTGKGYWLASQTGAVYSVGDAGFFGSAAGTLGPDVEIVDLAASPTSRGYWLLDGSGGVHAFGDAGFFGSAASLPPRYPITGIAATSTGKGYWLIDALGGVFAYGDAQAFPADTTSYSAYSVETALQDAVISIKPVPYGQGFVYGRLRGGFAGKGAGMAVAPSPYYGYGYGGTSFQQGSVAVDLAFNAPALQPSPEAGKVVRRGQAGLRAPEKVCTEVPDVLSGFIGVTVPRECALTPLPPNSPLPAPPGAPPAPITPPAASVRPARALGPVPTNDPSAEPDMTAGNFGSLRVGSRSDSRMWTLTNPGLLPLTIGDVVLERGPATVYGTDDDSGRTAFAATTDCADVILLPRASCQVAVTFAPRRAGMHNATLRVFHDGPAGSWFQPLTGAGSVGVYVAGAFGEVLTFGDAKSHGDLSHDAIRSPVLTMATTPSGEGYWLTEATGQVHPFGDAPDLGSPVLPAAEYAVTMAATPTGKGYWLATQKGGVHAFGDAVFSGSAAGTLGEDVDIIGMAATPTGRGYWLLDSVGGVRAYGDAGFFGAAASRPPRYPVNGIAATPTGQGYWLMDAVGGVFSYGDADTFGPDRAYAAYDAEYALQNPVMSLETAPFGRGFVFVRMVGSFGTMGADLGFTSPVGYGNGTAAQLQRGSVAVDVALNVAPQPVTDGGTVTRQDGPALRAPGLDADDQPGGVAGGGRTGDGGELKVGAVAEDHVGPERALREVPGAALVAGRGVDLTAD